MPVDTYIQYRITGKMKNVDCDLENIKLSTMKVEGQNFEAKENEIKVAKELLEQAQALAARVEEKSVTVTIKAGEGGKIFGSVSTKEISSAVNSQLGLDLDKKKMQLTDPIKSLGTHIVPVRLHKDVIAKLTVKVVEE